MSSAHTSLPKGTYNTLVLSDVHLGEDLKPSVAIARDDDGYGGGHHIDLVERELAAFLRHYARKRHDGKPWRLVINGDLVDFLAVCLMPGDDHDSGDVVTSEDRVYGVGRRPREARLKLEAVVMRHPDFFLALAQFVAAGNVVEINAGNHDAEFQWPAVQEAFVQGVTRVWRESAEAKRPGARSAEEIGGAIHFHPWFFYEPGVMWIEHGHQYDECCSFEFALNPMHPESEQILANVDTAGSRYLTNHIPDSDPHAQDDWNMIGYARWAVGLGARGFWRLIKAYYMFSVSLLAVWRWHRSSPRAYAERERTHDERLRALGARWRLPEATLRAVDSLRRRPVITSLSRLMKVLMLDKILVLAITALALLVAVTALPGLWKVAGVLAAVAGGGLMMHRANQGRIVDPGIPMLLMPERILRHIDARFVVFGHTHDPIAEPLPDGGAYYNTGTWVPAQKPGMLRAFTHLVVRHTAAGPVAELCQWRDGASRAFTPGREAPRLSRRMTAEAAA